MGERGRGGDREGSETENEMFSLTRGVDSALCVTRCAGIPLLCFPEPQDNRSRVHETFRWAEPRVLFPSPPLPFPLSLPCGKAFRDTTTWCERFRRAIARGRLASSFCSPVRRASASARSR